MRVGLFRPLDRPQQKGRIREGHRRLRRSHSIGSPKRQGVLPSWLFSQRTGAMDVAIADYTRAIKLDPKFLPAYHNRAHDYYGRGEYDKAIADYTEELRLNPKFAEAFHGRGWAYKKLGDNVKAEEDFLQAKRLGLQR